MLLKSNQANKAALNIPLKIILDEDAQVYLQKSNIKFSSIKLSDGRVFQGITVNKYHLRFLQSFIINGNLLSAELKLSDITKHRQSFTDLIKGFTYGVFYRKFSSESFELLRTLGLVAEWNRTYPKLSITKQHVFPQVNKILTMYKKHILEKHSSFLHKVQLAIKSSRIFPKEEYAKLSSTVQNLIKAAGPQFLILAFLTKSSSSDKAQNAIIRLILQSLRRTSTIPDYLSMLLIELCLYVGGYLHIAENIVLPGITKNNTNDTIIIWNFNKKSSLIRSDRIQMKISISNKYSEYHNLKSQIVKTSQEIAKHSSIQEYYLTKGNDVMRERTLGLSYLSFVADMCSKQNIQFDSLINTIEKINQTLFSVVLRI